MSAAGSAVPPEVHTLYVQHRSWLHGWLRRRLGNTFDAADLTQDTFVSVIAGRHGGEIREPRPFLATVAARLIAHRRRRQLLETAYLEALAAQPPAFAPSPEERLLTLEALQEVDRALDGLPPPAREAFLLAHLEGLTYAQIADQLKVSASSVKQYLTRANRQCLFALGH